MNLAIIIGNLGADPEHRQTQGGQSVCTLSVATNESYTDRDGNRVDRTEWHRVVVWGKTADNCSRYLAKGRRVAVEGKIQTRSWDDQQTGQKRYSTEIVAHRVEFLGGNGQGGQEGGGAQGYGGGGQGSQGGPRGSQGGGYGGGGQRPPQRQQDQPRPSRPASEVPQPGPDQGYYDDDDVPF